VRELLAFGASGSGVPVSDEEASTWETELCTMVEFVEHDVTNLVMLLRTTPPEELLTDRSVASMGVALDVLINGWRDVFHQLADITKETT
jgi:hypothetical protein